jgi:serpin B
MVDVFDPKRADLTGMTTVRELFVSEVFHKAFVAVDERDTEAASAAEVGIRLTCFRIVSPADLIVDRPFLPAIEHEPSGELLVVGRLIDPPPDRAAGSGQPIKKLPSCAHDGDGLYSSATDPTR